MRDLGANFYSMATSRTRSPTAKVYSQAPINPQILKSTPPQNLQLNTLISVSKQQVDDFVGELTFYNHSIDTLCETNTLTPHPQTINYQPSTLNPQPHTPNPKP